ncbi:MAG: PAC2 family protein, partial [Nitrososphaerales archaeon]
VADLVGVHLYHARSKSRDIVLLAGYGSPASDEYEFGSEILSFAKKLGVNEVVSIGARWNEEPLPPLEDPKVLGFSTDEEGAKWLEKNGVTLLKSEAAYYFANTVVGMAPVFGLRGSKLSVNHGEPRPHPRSLIAFLEVLKKKLDMPIDTSTLESKASELAEVIRTSGYESASIGETGSTGGETKQEDIYR